MSRLVCYLTIFSAPALAQHEVMTPYTLGMGLKAAMERNADVLQKREEVRQAELNLTKAWQALFPAVTLTFGADDQKDPANNSVYHPVFDGNPYNVYQYSVGLNQPILAGGALWGAVQHQRLDLDVKKTALEISERNLAINVIRAFYGILLADANYKNYVEGERIREELLGIAQSRYRVGNERELAVLQIHTDLALLRPQTVTAKTNLDTAALNLAYLVGENETVALRLVGTLDPPDWNSLQARLAKTSGFSKLEVKSAQLQIDEIEKQKLITMAVHYPTVSVIANLGRKGNAKSDLADDDATNWMIGLNVSIPLFSGLSSISDRRILASQEAELRIVEKDTRDQAATALATALKNVQGSWRALQLGKDAAVLAERSVPLARSNYNLGISTYVEISDAEKNELQAELSLQQAREFYLEKIIDYFAAAGWPLDEFVNSLPKLANRSGR